MKISSIGVETGKTSKQKSSKAGKARYETAVREFFKHLFFQKYYGIL